MLNLNIEDIAFTLNTTEYENGIIAYSEDISKEINISLENENIKYSIINSNNEFILQSKTDNKINFLKYKNYNTIFESNVEITNKLKTKIIENDTYFSQNHLFISENKKNVEINENFTKIYNDIYFDGYLNISNISQLPSFIPILYDGKLLPSCFPINKENIQTIYGNGSNVGIGTTESLARLHIKDGSVILEQSFLSINSGPMASYYSNLSPKGLLHIRHSPGYSNEATIILTNSEDKDKIILLAEVPFIGIGISSNVRKGNIQLYVDKDIECSNIFTNSINIGDNLLFNKNNFNGNFNMNGDLLFDNKSTKDAILKFYGSSNMSFGRGYMDINYRLDILQETSNILSIGCKNNINPHILFYKKDKKEEGIKLSMNTGDNLCINNNIIITENKVGDLCYKNNINFNNIENNPLNITYSNINKIKNIIVYTNYTFFILENGLLYYIYDKLPILYPYLWFYDTIKKIEEHSGILIMYCSNDIVYYIKITDILWFGKIINCTILTYNGTYFIINYKKEMYIKHHLDVINILLNKEDVPELNIIKKIGFLGDTILILNEINSFYKLTLKNNILINNDIIENVYNFEMEIDYIYILTTTNIVNKYNYKLEIINQLKTNVKEINVNNTNILYILKSDKVFYNSEEILLKTSILNIQSNLFFINGKISNTHILLIDNKLDLLYIKPLTDSLLGTGRNNTIYPLFNLLPVNIPIVDILLNCTNTLTIGKSLQFLKGENIIDNSLLVEKSIGIRTNPISDFALSIKGDINIIEGSIYVNGNIIESLTAQENYSSNNLSTGIIGNLTEYVKKDVLQQEIGNIIDNYYNKTYINENYLSYFSNNNIISNIVNEKFNILQNIELENKKLQWNIKNEIDYNLIYINNVTVGINTSNIDYTDFDILGINTIPALYVANYGNIRGAVFDGDIASFSDRILKKNITMLENSLEKTLKLKGRNYIRKDDLSEKINMGLIAQEVEEIIPEVVSEFNGKKTVLYQNIIALLIESIKELNEKICNLSAMKT